MPEQLEQTSLTERLRAIPGLAPLVAEAESTWRARALAAEASAGGSGADDSAGGPRADGGPDAVTDRPGWRAFEDAFPTFYEFTNRPR